MSIEQQAQEWLETFKLNHWIIEKQVEGLSHDQTLLKLPFRANCMNWVLGHLAEHRDWMLRAVDQTTLMPAQDALRYRRGSEPISDPGEAVALAPLLDYLRRARECLLVSIEAASTDFLIQTPDTGLLMESQRERTRLQRLQGLLWHETYHVGQLEILRQVAGTDDRVLT